MNSYFLYDKQTLTKIYRAIGRKADGSPRKRKGPKPSYIKRLVTNAVWDGVAIDQVIHLPEVQRALDANIASIEEIKKLLAQAKNLYGHRMEKTQHFHATMAKAGAKLKRLSTVILEHCAGGIVGMDGKDRDGGMTQLFKNLVSQTGGDVHYFRSSSNTALATYCALKAVLNYSPIKTADGEGYNMCCIDGWTSYLLWLLFEEGYFDLLDPTGTILFVSTFDISPRGMPETNRTKFLAEFGSYTPTHDQMVDYVHRKADEANWTCELLEQTYLTPDDAHRTYMRHSFFLKRK